MTKMQGIEKITRLNKDYLTTRKGIKYEKRVYLYPYRYNTVICVINGGQNNGITKRDSIVSKTLHK